MNDSENESCGLQRPLTSTLPGTTISHNSLLLLSPHKKPTFQLKKRGPLFSWLPVEYGFRHVVRSKHGRQTVDGGLQYIEGNVYILFYLSNGAL